MSENEKLENEVLNSENAELSDEDLEGVAGGGWGNSGNFGGPQFFAPMSEVYYRGMKCKVLRITKGKTPFDCKYVLTATEWEPYMHGYVNKHDGVFEASAFEVEAITK